MGRTMEPCVLLSVETEMQCILWMSGIGASVLHLLSVFLHAEPSRFAPAAQRQPQVRRQDAPSLLPACHRPDATSTPHLPGHNQVSVPGPAPLSPRQHCRRQGRMWASVHPSYRHSVSLPARLHKNETFKVIPGSFWFQVPFVCQMAQKSSSH